MTTATMKTETFAKPDTDALGLLRFLFTNANPERQYLLIKVDSLDPNPNELFVLYRDEQFQMMVRDKTDFGTWLQSMSYGSPARPPVLFSPVALLQPAYNAATADCGIVWARWPIQTVRVPKVEFPQVNAESRRLTWEKIAALPVTPNVIVDEGCAVSAFYKLKDTVSAEYAALVSDKIAVATNAERQRRVARAVFSAQQSAKETYFPLPGQKAKVVPAHTIHYSIAESTPVRVEALAKWAFPL